MGGYPCWLNAMHPPPRNLFECPACKQRMAFILQIYNLVPTLTGCCRRLGNALRLGATN